MHLRRWAIVTAALTIALPLALAQSSEQSGSSTTVSGVWKLSVDKGDGTFQDGYLNLSQSGNSVSGTVINNYSPQKILRGTFEDGKLHFEINPWRDVIDTYEGVLQDGKLNVTISTNRSANSHGESQRGVAVRDSGAGMKPPAPLPVPALHDVPDNGLARTPPMGWNSWNHFAGRVNDQVVRAAADAIASSGMKDAGYIYVNIDDTWEGERDAQGNITTNKKFPDMKALADYVHSKGLKIGIYSSPGPTTCAGYPGSYGHEQQDADTYAKWGIDYLKYDWCSAGKIYKDADLRPVYQKMGDALEKSGRKIVYSLCEYGRGDVWKWGGEVGGNAWRTTGDISDRWQSMSEIGFKQIDIAQYAKPGQWNDPDMLEVGNGGMTKDEYQTHMTLWSLLSAPLLAGNDLEHMSDETKELLMNRDVIAIDQDTAVHHPKRTDLGNGVEVWTREMADGSNVVAVFNRADHVSPVTVNWSQIGLSAPTSAKNLWTHQDVTMSGDSYGATIPTHGVLLLRVGKS